jgi:ubiquinone/menaquinone biosynthesis C-methylase UbiE
MKEQTIDWNLAKWDGQYDWPEGGEEWSVAWGGSQYQWQRTILPRVASALPCSTVLEIAPGHGRWTHYLIGQCRRYMGIDISSNAIARCKQRFGHLRMATFSLGDGSSLTGVADSSVDFVFSFDSLVHCELDVIESYLVEIRRVLKRGGLAFIHHSNMADHKTADNPHLRATSVSAEKVRDRCEEHGLCIVTQELVNWGHDLLTDCFSLIALSEDEPVSAPGRLENPRFHIEVDETKRIADHYTF